MMDFAFLILDSILASLFSRGVIKEPRYLNLVTKWIQLLSGRIRFSGIRFFSTWEMASLRVAEKKNRHSVLDFVVGQPICMVRPKRAKCLFSWTRAEWSSCLFVKMKKLLST